MCQRIMIAIALACRRAADRRRATTGLDVTTQAVIMDLIDELGRDSGMATIFITHDLALAASIVIASWSCMPAISSNRRRAASCSPMPAIPIRPSFCGDARRDGLAASLASIPGGLPDLRRDDLPACRYSGRCERMTGLCAQPLPHRHVGERHDVACWNPL